MQKTMQSWQEHGYDIVKQDAVFELEKQRQMERLKERKLERSKSREKELSARRAKSNDGMS